MIKTHFGLREASLLSLAEIATSTGHPLHKGTAREVFVRQFLRDHLSEQLAVGTGEIFDSQSLPGQKRNQHDVILYWRSYPRLDFGGVTGHFAESVVATIEVKSKLTKSELRKAISAGAATKKLAARTPPVIRTGYVPPHILCYVLAYDGPVKMKTVCSWLRPIHAELGIDYPAVRGGRQERMNCVSTSIDGVFVLGKGFLCLDNGRVSFLSDEIISERPKHQWYYTDMPSGSLMYLFLTLTDATAAPNLGSWDIRPYVSTLRCDIDMAE